MAAILQTTFSNVSSRMKLYDLDQDFTEFCFEGPIYNLPALVQIVGCRRPGDKPFFNQCWLHYRRRYVSLGLSELR